MLDRRVPADVFREPSKSLPLGRFWVSGLRVLRFRVWEFGVSGRSLRGCRGTEGFGV